MGYTLKSIQASSSNYGSTRSASAIKYIVVHYTANSGDTAENNGNYFKNNIVKASAHYFVDKNTVVHSVDDLKVAYSVGGSKYTDCSSTGGGTMYGKITNRNSISVELCDSIDSVPVATKTNAIKLIESLMLTYGIDKDHIYRHFDVNGKHCPACLMTDSAWRAFKADIGGSATTTATVSTANDIAYRLKKAGIASASDYWMGRMQKESTVLALCKNIANYTLANSKGAGTIKLTTANDIIYRLFKAGILTNKSYWMAQIQADKNLFALCRNAAEWTV